MGKTQKYGIKYPFTLDNEDGFYVDLNKTISDGVKSQLLHLIFTPKGQKLRDPNFGTDLIKFIFEPKDSNFLFRTSTCDTLPKEDTVNQPR